MVLQVTALHCPPLPCPALPYPGRRSLGSMSASGVAAMESELRQQLVVGGNDFHRALQHTNPSCR